MTDGGDDLGGRRSVAGPAAIAVTPFQDHPEGRMVGGLRHAPLERPAEVEDPCRAEAGQQAPPPIRPVGQSQVTRAVPLTAPATTAATPKPTNGIPLLPSSPHHDPPTTAPPTRQNHTH